MEFGVHLGNYGPAAGRDTITRLAAKAEELGFHSVWASDHIIIPAPFTPRYPYGINPYSPGGAFTPEATQNFYEPLVTLSFVAGATQRVRIGTSVLILPYRNQVAAAKMLSTLDALSNGRVILGVGMGWLEEEFRALGVSAFAERGALSDEYLQIFKELWTKDEPSFRGKYYEFAALRFFPKPVQKPHPPIWVGGHTPAALRRAATMGDGWHASRLGPEGMAQGVARLRELAAQAGRDAGALTISLRCNLHITAEARGAASREARRGGELVGTPGEIMEGLREYRQAGVDSIIFNIRPGASLAERVETMERFAQEVMPQLDRD